MTTMKILPKSILVALTGMTTALGCVNADEGPGEDLGTVQQAEEWDDVNAPTNFSHLGASYEYELAALPRQGEAQTIPWAGWYWATATDAINYRWDGPNTDSPTAKYAEAFGLNPKKLENALSRRSGIDSLRGRVRSCTVTSQCNANNGEICAKRQGRVRGLCIPTWFGQCHAWAPAAIMEPEPEHAVTYNGVTFKVQDLKALITYVYNNVPWEELGDRCDTNSPDVTYDEYGRPENIQCRDTNPGSFHLIVTNWLGLHGKSFVEDRTWDDEVWNQPMRGYNIKKQEQVSEAEAAQLMGLQGVSYIFNSNAASFYHVIMDVEYIAESGADEDGNLNEDNYTKTDKVEYLLELDGQGRIIGGEWIDNAPHADFLWVPTGTAGDVWLSWRYKIEYAKVKNLLNQSIR